jgi:hypothetical protein
MLALLSNPRGFNIRTKEGSTKQNDGTKAKSRKIKKGGRAGNLEIGMASLGCAIAKNIMR